jgi:hypothetical protein
MEQSYKVLIQLFGYNNFFIYYQDLRFPSPSQMHSELDQKAAAYVCLRHCSLQKELGVLQVQYDQTMEYAKDCATRIEETKGKLDELTTNIAQLYCDALDVLSVPVLEGNPDHAGLIC